MSGVSPGNASISDLWSGLHHLRLCVLDQGLGRLGEVELADIFPAVDLVCGEVFRSDKRV